MSMPPPTLFDQDLAMDRLGGGEQRFRDMAQFFLSYSLELLLELEEALDKNEIALLAEKAHKLKGSLGMLGAQKAYLTAGQLEEVARSDQSAKCRGLFIQTKTEVEALRAELKLYIESRRP